MELKTPTTLNEAIIAIAELQASSNWLQGQSNLLLGFITADPENRSRFAQFAHAITQANEPGIDEMKFAAKTLLDGGLAQQLPPDTPPPSGDKPFPGPNVIRFPEKHEGS